MQWANPKFYVTHEKSMVVDEKTALVATFNMCLKYFTATRDYGVIIDDPVHVTQIVEVFNADWNHDDWVPSVYEGLLWSNSNSRLHMARFIDTACTASTNLGCWTSMRCTAVSMNRAMWSREFELLHSRPRTPSAPSRRGSSRRRTPPRSARRGPDRR